METLTDKKNELEQDVQTSEQMDVTSEQSVNIGINSKSVEMEGKYSAGTIGTINVYEPVEKKEEDTVSCPRCGTVPDETNYGTIKCRKCNTVYIVSTSFSPRITTFPNIPKEKDQSYKDLIAHISNFVILGNYVAADDYCNQAIDLSPATPQAWEYKAYCTYFLTSNKKFLINTEAEGLVRYLLVAKSHYINEEELDTIGSFKSIAERIADRMFNMINHRIFYSRQHKEEDIQKCRLEISKLIYSFRICHRIYPYKTIYLETILSMYLGYDEESWINLEIDELESKGYKLIDNTHLEGHLFELIEIFTNLIQQQEKEYILMEMKGGEFGENPILISELLAEKNSEFEKLKETEKLEEIQKKRFERELEIRFRQ